MSLESLRRKLDERKRLRQSLTNNPVHDANSAVISIHEADNESKQTYLFSF